MSKQQMPTYLTNKEGQSVAIAYTYSELTTEKILVETETFKKNKKRELDTYAGFEGYDTLKAAYDSLGMCETYEGYIKTCLIGAMVKEGKLKSYHDRENDKFLWILC